MIILTTFDLDEYVFAGLQAGASGFLLKDALAADLLAAIRVVAAGQIRGRADGDPRLIEHFVGTVAGPAPDATRLDVLTAREREVLTSDRARPVKPRDRSDADRHGGHGQDPHQPDPRQARSARPDPSRHPRIRNRPRHDRLVLNPMHAASSGVSAQSVVDLASVLPMAPTRLDEAAGLTVADVTHSDFKALPASATVGEVRAWFAASESRRLALLAGEGRYVGSLVPEDVAGEVDPARLAVELARREPTVAPDEPASRGEELALRTDTRRVPVVDHDGRLLGIVAVTPDLQRFCGTDGNSERGGTT